MQQTTEWRKRWGVGVFLVPIVALLVSAFYLDHLSSTTDSSAAEHGPALKVNFVAASELRQWLEQGRHFVLLDTRTLHEYTSGHIPTAVSVHRYLGSAEDIKGGAPHVPVVFYCDGPTMVKSGPCVRAIVRELQRGSSQVYWVKGGMRTWRDHGYPVMEGPKNGSHAGVIFGR